MGTCLNDATVDKHSARVCKQAGGLIVAAVYYHQLRNELRPRYSDSNDQLTHHQHHGGFYDAYGRK